MTPGAGADEPGQPGCARNRHPYPDRRPGNSGPLGWGRAEVGVAEVGVEVVIRRGECVGLGAGVWSESLAPGVVGAHAMGVEAVGVELVEALVRGGQLIGQPLDLVFEPEHPPCRVEVEALVE